MVLLYGRNVLGRKKLVVGRLAFFLLDFLVMKIFVKEGNFKSLWTRRERKNDRTEQEKWSRVS